MAKTKTLISFAVTAKLICVFVFAYANCWFSHAKAHFSLPRKVSSDRQVLLLAILFSLFPCSILQCILGISLSAAGPVNIEMFIKILKTVHLDYM